MKYIVNLWNSLGKSGSWLAMFSFTILFELVVGSTIKGMFYAFICMLGYFLSRIAEAIEKNGE